MERLKNIKETLISSVQAQVGGNLKEVDAKELGEAVDMIKDLEEAIYYCSITEAMKNSEEESKHAMKYSYPPVMYDGKDMKMNYYDGTAGRGGRVSGGRMYYEGRYPYDYRDENYSYPMELRDYREGRSPMTRRNYMESKELHHDKSKQMQELEKYMNELTQDIMEMINDASPEEKQILSQKLGTLAGKIK